MSTYRVGNHHGITICSEGDGHRCDLAGHDCARGHLVAVVTNGDAALAERICRLLNADEPEGPVCDCGAEGLSTRFHRKDCPVMACNCGHEGLDSMFHIDCPVGSAE